MERINADNSFAPVRAADVLAAGGVILYPTDTLYGLGADAFSDDAVAAIYAIKGREEGKPIHVIVADGVMMVRYGQMNGIARSLAERFLPGPLTLILKKKQGIDTGIARDRDTIGLRIPENEFCLALARAFDRPYTTTSANVSGMKPERTVDAILAQLGEMKSWIDLVIDAGELPERLPSTVVDVSTGAAIVLREGAIPASDILF